VVSSVPVVGRASIKHRRHVAKRFEIRLMPTLLKTLCSYESVKITDSGDEKYVS
jgi:hypothetical protein